MGKDDNVPIFGKKKEYSEKMPDGPAPLNFMGIPITEDFITGLIYRVIVPGVGEFYTEAPMVIEPGIIGLVQAFAWDSNKKVVLEYRNLSFMQVPGISSYLVKPPQPLWSKVLKKERELPE